MTSLVIGTLIREGIGAAEPATPSATVTEGRSVRASPTGPAPTDGLPPSGADASTASFPGPAEQELLRLVDARDHQGCGPSTEDALPRIVDRGALGGAIVVPAHMRAGVLCAPFRVGAPDEVAFWYVSDTWEMTAEEVILNLGGVRSAVRATCDEAVPAQGAWSFGPLSGRQLCFVNADQDAVVYWTYTGTNILARAVRRDGDMASLLDWWADDGRTRSP